MSKESRQVLKHVIEDMEKDIKTLLNINLLDGYIGQLVAEVIDRAREEIKEHKQELKENK